MKSAKAFAPGNVSCIFVIRKGTSPAKSGSLGVGFTVNKGVFATIKKIPNNKNIIYFNNKKINFPTVNSVIEKLTNKKVKVNIKSELPLGCGFGLSGASALAVAYALNKLFNLKTLKNSKGIFGAQKISKFSSESKKELALIAHIAEVENGTGLGDVVNQYYGGFLIKYKPSYMFKVEKIPISNKKIYYQYFSSIDTKKIVSNQKIKNRINSAGIKALNKIKKLNGKDVNLKNLIKISKEFSINSGLINKKILKIINKIESKGGNASMIMLGNAVFSDKYFKGSKELIIKDKGAFIKC